MTSNSVWEGQEAYWIDVYQGPPERIVHDAGKKFTSDEFKQNAGALAVEVKEVPVEAHHSIGKVERYHGPLRRAYEIIQTDCLSPSIKLWIVWKRSMSDIEFKVLGLQNLE